MILHHIPKQHGCRSRILSAPSPFNPSHLPLPHQGIYSYQVQPLSSFSFMILYHSWKLLSRLSILSLWVFISEKHHTKLRFCVVFFTYSIFLMAHSTYSSLLTDTSYATLFSVSTSPTRFTYSRLWIRPHNST